MRKTKDWKWKKTHNEQERETNDKKPNERQNKKTENEDWGITIGEKQDWK
jgi:hypothetical protein